MTVKDKAYLVLIELGGRATEGELVDKYIQMYPDYDKHYTDTKTSSKAKIRGTISVELNRNSLHEKIKVDNAKQPFEYYVDTTNDGWSKEELLAAVNAYMDMQQKERQGQPFTKKQYYENLSSRFGRPEKAFEYRMQNISYVMTLLGRDWLTGLKPAKNVGGKIASEIEAMIASAEGRQFIPVAAFEIKAREEVKRKHLTKPKGNRNPTSTSSSITQYKRDAAVKAWVLRQANGKCECCDQPAPFNNSDGQPYLEVHHVRQLADKGSDTIYNMVALCPNCHKAVHYGENSRELVSRLYERISRLVRE
ncbi:HNH endonuclease [Sulfurimonas sp. HSL1-6]|uniref:HNH endonuclease n=1 Tax=Thiomicrolovo immobilis TaxID=3131935 RepID=UPI0031F8B6C4